MGERYGVLTEADDLVHLEAMPVAYSHPNEIIFRNYVISTYIMLETATSVNQKTTHASTSLSSGMSPIRLRTRTHPLFE